MNKTLFLVLALLLSAFCQAQITNKGDFSIGETFEISSEILGEDRTINVYLPDGYHPDSLKTYPVIYLLDGSRDEDFIHIAGLVQFCSFSWINIIPETIVIGIANVDRKRDFTYSSTTAIDLKEVPTSGKSEPFINFIANELQPAIEETYRVSGEKTLIGQSLGGLLATEILFKKPDLFDNYIIASPSLWWDSENLLDFELGQELADKKIYVGVGQEGKVMERLAKELYEKLEVIDLSDSVHFGYFEEQNHGDVLHLAAYDAFEKLFKKVEK